MKRDFTAHFCAIERHSRLDKLLSHCFPQFSRALLQQWVREGNIRVNSEAIKPAAEIKPQEEILIRASLPIAAPDRPVNLALDVIYEDSAIIAINKPSGLTVHPGAGNPANTLLNALLAYNPAQKYLPRAGLVHRLDKGTSGLILIAKETDSLLRLQEQLKERLIKRHYLALSEGVPISGGSITYPIGRDPRNRLRFKAYASATAATRPAVTHYRVKHKFACHCLLDVYLETGRTHQIRCHLAADGYPLVGDRLYGARCRIPPGCSASLTRALQKFNHQALHSHSLVFSHPAKQTRMELRAPLPAELRELLTLLEESQAL